MAFAIFLLDQFILKMLELNTKNEIVNFDLILIDLIKIRDLINDSIFETGIFENDETRQELELATNEIRLFCSIQLCSR